MTRYFAILVSSILAAAASAADWPTFRGNPAQNGIAADTLPDRLDIRWQVKLGSDPGSSVIESTAAIVNGVAYVGAFDDHLHAFDLATGQEKWKVKTGAIKAPVGVHEGAVYAGNVDGVFSSLDAATGQLRWKRDVQAEVTSGPNFTTDGVLFGTQDETLHCLGRTDGKPKWSYQINGGPVMGTPAVANGRTFAAGCDSTLHVLDVASGKEVSSVNLNGQVGAAAAVRDGRLYVGTMSNQVIAVDLDKTVAAWTFEPERRRQPFYASAAVTDKLVLIGSRDRRLYALDRATGKQVWDFPTDGKVDSSPVVVGQRVYFGSHDGNLYVLELATGKEVQKVKLNGPVSASPAVASGCLVIGTERGTVYCLGAAK
jgi:outer membrane protein assembly factor BamB